MRSRKKFYLALIAFFIILMFALLGVFFSQNRMDAFSRSNLNPSTAATVIDSPTVKTNAISGLPTETATPALTPDDLPPALTPLPTFSADRANEFIRDLYKNSPCRLPCWWNIVPGETGWDEAWQFLDQFSLDRFPPEEAPDISAYESKEKPGFVFFHPDLNIRKTTTTQPNQDLDDLWLGVNLDTYTVDYISVETGVLNNYTIPLILSTYGEPQEIYAYGTPSEILDNGGITIILYYPQYDFMSSHFVAVGNNEWNQSILTSCFQQTSHIEIWPQNENLEFKERFDKNLLNITKTIDQVTDFSVHEFYQEFSSEYPTFCISFNTKDLLRIEIN